MQMLYVNNNDPLGNNVSALEVDPSGVLSLIAPPYATGGIGMQALNFGVRGIAHMKGRLLFVSNHGDHTITAFKIGANGKLMPGSTVPASVDLTFSGSLAVAPRGILFVGGMNGISALSVGVPPGIVSTLPGPPVTDLAVSPNGRFLVASVNWAEIRTYYLGVPGYLYQAGPPQPVTAASGLAFAALGAASALLFVGSYGAGLQIAVFKMDLFTGALTPVPGSPFSFASGSGSSYLRYNAKRNLLVGNNNSRSVTVLKVGPGGQLKLCPGSPVSTTSNNPVHSLSGVDCDEAGKLVFVGNAGLDVEAFSVPPPCRLKRITGSPFSTGNTSPGAFQSGGILFVRR